MLPRSSRLLVSFFILGLLFFTCGQTYAQSPRNEFSVAYGTVTSSQIVDILTNVLLITITIGKAAKVDNEYPGALVLTYKHSGKSRLGFGFTMAVDRARGNLAMNGVPVGTYTENYYTGALEADFRYINRKNFCLYSGVGVGLTLRKGKYTYSETEQSLTLLPAFQVTAIGFRVGDRIAFFGELGGGYKGVLHGGIRFTL